ncbi:MAG: hydroxyethylthiazole kinase [Clostridia bacterium]|jgi:hydroxyethylthiazole kinase|nr:hydroxyethylthiazole kinase [Clostridia bacterium]MCI2014103.1 hydroxyethylthiazole kinase [Clostridia bacterium]
MDIFEKSDLIFKNIREIKPVVHNISNIVTANDCANITLALGGSPTMAGHPDEVEDVTSGCNGFVINMGDVAEPLVEAMLRAGKRNNEIGHPVILDPVGAGAAKKINDVLFELLKNIKFSVIRGNVSEIKFIATGSGSAKGVDADESDKVTDENIDIAIDFAKKLSKKTGAVIAISGEIDIISDENNAYIIKNGHAEMSNVTGTGCMLSSVLGVFCAANLDDILDACAVAVSSYGYAGELAYRKMVETDSGTASFRMFLIDYVSKMNAEIFKGGAKIERR